jgi:hypothetical protein
MNQSLQINLPSHNCITLDVLHATITRLHLRWKELDNELKVSLCSITPILNGGMQ